MNSRSEILDTSVVRSDAGPQNAGGMVVVRKADHYRPGEYVAAAALCGCRAICVAPLDTV